MTQGSDTSGTSGIGQRHANGNLVGRICSLCGFPAPLHSTGCAQYVDMPVAAVAIPVAPDPAETRRTYVAIGVLMGVLGSSVAGLLAGVVMALDGPPAPASIVALQYSVQAALGLVGAAGTAMTWRQSRESWKWPARPAWFVWAALGSLATFAVAYGALAALHSLGVPIIKYGVPFQGAGLGIGWLLAMMCVMAPVGEEAAFRGVIQPAMEKAVGPIGGLMIASGTFAIAHLSLLSLPQLVLMGMAFGWVRRRSGSVWPCILMHALHNLWVVLTQWYPGLVPGVTY